MTEYLNTIINNPSSTPKQILLAKEWLELDAPTGGKVEYEKAPQILSADWEEEILLQFTEEKRD